MTQNFKVTLLGGEHGTPMTCREAHCEQYEKGWVTALNPADADHAILIYWLRSGRSGRSFKDCPAEDAPAYLPPGNENISLPPGCIVFIFEPGQQCFRVHEDREVVFSHEKRGARRIHAAPRDFNEHFNEQAYSVRRARERG